MRDGDLIPYLRHQVRSIVHGRMVIAAVLLCILASCSEDEIPIGDDFVLYKQEGNLRYFNCIGLEVGGTQKLIEGRIKSYGSDSRFVVAKMENNSYYFFEKAAVKMSPQPTREVDGPFGPDEFAKKARELNLPAPVHIPPN